MNIWIVGLFEQFSDILKNTGVIGKALSQKNPSIHLHHLNPCSFSPRGHKNVDASPYGGGAGQVMRADVLENVFLKGSLKIKMPALFMSFI